MELVKQTKDDEDPDPILMNQGSPVKNRKRKSSLEYKLPSESSDISTPASSFDFENRDTLWTVIRSSLKDKKMRSLMLLYGTSSACTNSEILVSMLYIQTKWEEQGLGLHANQVVSLSVIAFFPSVVILLFTGEIVPRIFSVQSFIRIVIIIFSSSVFLLPVLRDILPEASQTNWVVGNNIFFNQSFSFFLFKE